MSSESGDKYPDRPTGAGHWLLWQLGDSAFPAGSFAHSAGLEAAWQHWNDASGVALPPLSGVFAAALEQAATGAAPFTLAARRHPDQFSRWDRSCDVQLINHVANRGSRSQGRALLTAAVRIFAATGLADASLVVRAGGAGHFAPVFGVVAAALNIPIDETARLFLFITLRGLVSAAVRLGAVGPLEAQAIQHSLGDFAEQLSKSCAVADPEDAAQTAPLLDLFQATQDRLYSRLFQS